MKNAKTKNEGDGAPSTAPNQEDEHEFTVVDEETSLDGETKADNQESNAEDEPNTDEQDEKPEGEDAGEEANEKADSKNDEKTDESPEKPKLKFSGAARKRYRHFLSLGYTADEARDKALVPVGPKSVKRPGANDKDHPSSKKARSGDDLSGIKICIVPDKFPEEVMTPEQSKAVQESITDQILEMGGASTIKPKFNSSTHETGFLALMCADKSTVEWLKNITPTLKPWEEAALKALADEEMPHPEIFVGFLPDSEEYSDDKILKLLEAQNENFNVSTWKVVKRETVDKELELTFSIDRKYTGELKKASYKVNYKFGQVELWPKGRKSASEKSKDSRSKSPGRDWKRGDKPKASSYKGPPDRSSFRGAPKSYVRGGSNWGGNRGKGYKGPSNSRSGGSRPWESSFRRNQDTWYADSWNPWKK